MALGVKCTQLEEVDVDLYEEIDSLQVRVNALELADVELNGEVEALEFEVNTLSTDLTVVTARVVALEGADVVIDDRLGSLEDELDIVVERVTALEASDVIIDGRLDSLEDDVGVLDADVSYLGIRAYVTRYCAFHLGRNIYGLYSVSCKSMPQGTFTITDYYDDLYKIQAKFTNEAIIATTKFVVIGNIYNPLGTSIFPGVTFGVVSVTTGEAILDLIWRDHAGQPAAVVHPCTICISVWWNEN